ncbi:MAG: hypothetical protein GC191_11335 [Azospirillum sp.]|nr:hypothetical protein [Azospirillum sp.]
MAAESTAADAAGSETTAGRRPAEFTVFAALELLAAATLAGAAEAWLALVLFGAVDPPLEIEPAILAAAGHLGVAAGLGRWAWTCGARGRDQRLAGLLTLTIAAMGPVGAAATVMTAVLYGVFQNFSTSFREWYLSLFPESEVAPAQALYELIVSGREQSHLSAAESFTDIMAVGTTGQKQAVIALVARHFKPVFTPALKLALIDADPSVRVQAATAAARVEHAFVGQWLRLDGTACSHASSLPAQLALARHLDDYAFAGLLDAAREEEVRQQALASYRRCRALAPDDRQVRLSLGRLLLRLDQAAEAADCLEPLVGADGDRGVLLWYAECLFRLGRFKDLRRLCLDNAIGFDAQATLSPAVRDVIALWGGEETVD